MKMVLLVDNYDSFTYNLAHYVQTLGAELKVVRNDVLSASEIVSMKPSAILISPGAGNPKGAGICMELVRLAAGKIPVFGVCLGMQCVVEAFGGKISKAKSVMHGKISKISHLGKYSFEGIPSPMSVVRYHSLAADRNSFPDCLEITAECADGEIMGVRHRDFFVEGVQFHPESIMTVGGKRLIDNFLKQSNSK